jgi:hypothetical protein
MSAHRLSLELALCSQKICKTILIFSLFKRSGAGWYPQQAFPECLSQSCVFPEPVLRRLDRFPNSFCAFATLLTRAKSW